MISMLDTSCKNQFPRQATNDKKFAIPEKRVGSYWIDITVSSIKNIVFLRVCRTRDI